MKKRLAALLLVICMIAAYIPAGAAALPSSLTEIGNEAFRGDSSMTGLLILPGDVGRVGDHVFTGTGLYALRVPETVTYMGAQDFRNAAYVRMDGAATQVGALSGVRCVLAPSGSPALTAASGADAVTLDEVVAQDGFLYRAKGDALTLLCAEDPAVVGTSVTIPEEIDGKSVTAISGYTFIGCTSLAAIVLPAAVEPSVIPGATADCPAARISYYGGEHAQIAVNRVTAEVTAGAGGYSITWHVDAQAGDGVSYIYTVRRNGAAVATETSDEAAFVYKAEGAGAYQLLVTVLDRSGSAAMGESAMSYIAVEAMVMTLPECIEAGENLVIHVGKMEKAQGYTIYVTNEQTDELVKRLTPAESGDVTVEGYLLVPGEYRVSGYVHGNDFLYAVPTVRRVTVTGTMADGPVIPAQEPLLVNETCMIDLDGDEAFVIRHQLLSADGALTGYTYAHSEASGTAGICSNVYADGYQGGGVILVQASVLMDGKWTAWGPVTEITLNAVPTLPAPVVTAPATLRRGEDLVFRFQPVPDAVNYGVTIRRPDGTIDNIRNAVEYPGEDNRVNGFELQPGENTLIVAAFFADGSKTVTEKTFTVGSEPLPAAPTVTVNKTVVARGESPVFTIGTAGADEVYVFFGDNTTQVGVYDDQTQWIAPFVSGSGMIFRFYVRVDDVWTAQSEPIAITISDALPAPELTVADTLTLGRDLVVTVGEVEGGRDYHVVLCDASGYAVKNLYPDGPGSIAIYGCYFQEGKYTIRAYTSNSEIAEATVTVTAPGTRPDAPAVTVETTEVELYAELPFLIDVTGADMVTMRIDDSVSAPVAVSGSTFRWPDDALWEGWMKYAFAVRVNGVWSPFSESILVNTVPTAVMAQPILDMPTPIVAGHDLVINVAAVEGAERYDATLIAPDVGWADDLYMDGSNGATFTFPGYLMVPGTGSIVVVASGYLNDTYESSNIECDVDITAGSQPAAPAVTAENEYALSGSSYAFTIDTTGADKAAVRRMAPDMVIPAASHYELTATGDRTTWTHSCSGPDGMRVKYAFSVCVDGVWSPWSEMHTVTIVDELPVQPAVSTCAE